MKTTDSDLFWLLESIELDLQNRNTARRAFLALLELDPQHNRIAYAFAFLRDQVLGLTPPARYQPGFQGWDLDLVLLGQDWKQACPLQPWITPCSSDSPQFIEIVYGMPRTGAQHAWTKEF